MKSVVWCINPAQQFFIGAALHLCGIDAHIFHAELDHFEREILVQKFCTQRNSYYVLICSFYVNSAGSNLQSLCRNMHLWDIPTLDRYVQQAVGRVRRLGQRKIVKVYDYAMDWQRSDKTAMRSIPTTDMLTLRVLLPSL